MQPVNKNERRKAFWNFFLLFMLSIIIVSITVYASTRMPYHQIDQLLAEADKTDKEHKFSLNFSDKMVNIMGRLDSINTMGNRIELSDARLKDDIKNIYLMGSDSIYNYPLYQNIGTTLESLRDTKAKWRAQTRENAKEDQLNTRIIELTTQLLAARDSLLNCQDKIKKMGGQ